MMKIMNICSPEVLSKESFFSLLRRLKCSVDEELHIREWSCCRVQLKTCNSLSLNGWDRLKKRCERLRKNTWEYISSSSHLSKLWGLDKVTTMLSTPEGRAGVRRGRGEWAIWAYALIQFYRAKQQQRPQQLAPHSTTPGAFWTGRAAEQHSSMAGDPSKTPRNIKGHSEPRCWWLQSSPRSTFSNLYPSAL